MAHAHLTRRFDRTEEALTVPLCLVDDAYRLLNPDGHRYGSLKRLSDSEVLALALLQQLRGVESQRSFLRDAERFFALLFPGLVGYAPSSFHRRLRKPRRFLEPLRRSVAGELAGDPETLVVARRCWRCCTRARSSNPSRAGGGPPRVRRGRGGAPSRCTA